MHRLAILFSMTFTMLVAAAPVYKVVKKDGSVVYTDKPFGASEKVKMPKQNTANIPVPHKSSSTSAQSNVKKVKRAKPNYQFSIESPSPEEHIRNNSGNVKITATMQPTGLGDYQLFVDNQLVQTQANPRFELRNFDRGEHQFQIKFLHKSGRVLAESPIQVFYLHRASVLSRAN